MQTTRIRPTVSPETIGKVTRLFNGAIADILNELLQNARRAGATRVIVTSAFDDIGARITIADDGSGIADPAKLLALGSSSWSDAVTCGEDPAGMGIFSLAGRDAWVVSRHNDSDQAWRVTIPADAWTGEHALPLAEADHPIGTTIGFAMSDLNPNSLANALKEAAQYYPLPVIHNGEELARGEFLADAIHVCEWRGSRIGVFSGRTFHRVPHANFHGLTICERLPELAESMGSQSYYTKLDIGSTAALQLVLPARKEFVQNEAYEAMIEACERAIYEAIAARPAHRLSFEHWQRAGELGVTLAEAEKVLPRWNPEAAGEEYYVEGPGELPIDEHAVLGDYFAAHFGQALAHGLREQPIRKRMALRHPRYEGYSWYDALPVLTAPEFAIRDREGTIIASNDDPVPDVEDHIAAEAITLGYTIVDPKNGATATCHVATNLAFILDAEGWYDDIEKIVIAYAADDQPDPETLVDLLEQACFCASDDSDADSWETQHDRFMRDAREVSARVLEGEDAAICSQFRDIIARYRWILPKGKALTIALSDEAFDVSVCDASIASEPQSQSA